MEYAVWIIFIVAMMIIEASTTNLVSIWFAFGALGAILAKALGGGVTPQILTFVILSGLSLAIAWPFIKKYHNGKKEATNADMLIGKTGVITEDITNDKFAGKVNVSGQIWSATSESGEDILEGAKVKIVKITGVKLVVEKM